MLRRQPAVLPPSRPLLLVLCHAWTSHSWPRHPPLGGGRALAPFLYRAFVMPYQTNRGLMRLHYSLIRFNFPTTGKLFSNHWKKSIMPQFGCCRSFSAKVADLVRMPRRGAALSSRAHRSRKRPGGPGSVRAESTGFAWNDAKKSFRTDDMERGPGPEPAMPLANSRRCTPSFSSARPHPVRDAPPRPCYCLPP